MNALAEILDGIEDHIQLLKEMGERTIEIDPAIWTEWKRAVSVRPAPRPVPAAHPQSVRPPAAHSTFQAPKQEIPTGAKILSLEERVAAMAQITQEIEACSICPFRENRNHIVPGQGNLNSPDVMFIGEAPGAEEDKAGVAFIGAAGQFLTKMINAMGYDREDVFIANICKCRPPYNRTPTPEEAMVCFPFLKRQIEIVRPKTIVLLGTVAAKAILNTQVGVTRLQGQWSRYGTIPVMPTYHPAYVIRFEKFRQMDKLKEVKIAVWTALNRVLAYLGKPVPSSKKKQ